MIKTGGACGVPNSRYICFDEITKQEGAAGRAGIMVGFGEIVQVVLGKWPEEGFGQNGLGKKSR